VSDAIARTLLEPQESRPGTTAPLRDAVLAGRYFGKDNQENAAQLATFLSRDHPHALTIWFGAERARNLTADPHAYRCALDRDIAALDRLIAAELDAILHHPRLQRLESSWRGLAWLADRLEPSSRVKVRVLNLPWPELCRDLERAAEFDQSLLFRKIYEEEFGSPGGEPYGLLVIDHEVRLRPAPGASTDDLSALAGLAGVAAAAFAPTVLAASPSLLEVDTFADLAMVGDVGAPFRRADYARWRSLAGLEDMRFLAVTAPRILARRRWGDDPGRPDGFRYDEFAPSVADRVWMTAGYAFAAAVIRAFTNHAWPADVRGSETDQLAGGLVDGLPVEPFQTDPNEVWACPPLDIVLTDRQERAMIDAGLMPVTALPFGTEALFAAVRSLQSPARYTGPTREAANANARLSTQINAILCASRFAHYLKLLGRQMVGGFRHAEEIERELQNWLTGYVNANLEGSNEARARQPLASASVSVRERPGMPGVFTATVHLQPLLQLDDISASFRLVTEIAGVEPQRNL
jgi:type VI secretion system ImpC/EvpB family protein